MDKDCSTCTKSTGLFYDNTGTCEGMMYLGECHYVSVVILGMKKKAKQILVKKNYSKEYKLLRKIKILNSQI